MIEQVLRLAQRGWALLPLRPREKKPLIRGWPELATPDPEVLRSWWNQWPEANVGIATGPKSGLLVLDFDGEPGLETLQELRSIPDWPETLTVKTGTGGYHLYFRWDHERPLPNSVRKLGPGVDIRGAGGYVVAPPSIHPNGNRYHWI